MKRKQLLRSFGVYFGVSFVTIFFAFYWRFLLLKFGNAYAGTPLEELEYISIKELLLMTLYVSSLLSFLSSILDVFFFRKAFEKRSLGQAIILSTIIQLLTIGFVIYNANRFAVRILFGQNTRLSVDISKIPDLGLIVLLLLFSIGISRFILVISQKLGKGNLWRLVRGKFFKPREERRIFMFVDLKSSTTIAEEIGHFKFSQLIQDCFRDLSIVDRYEAEVYQYVGDEVILTWKPNKGLIKNNYIKAFFAFKSVLKSKEKYYQKTYGVFPEFKAGANVGDCTVTEVGELKREICYHGDTINTTARIEALCNEYGAELLISEFLKFETLEPEEFSIEETGAVALKGKVNEITLYKITEK